MDFSFLLIAALIGVSAGAAMTLRNLVHCALCLALTFAGLAALYLQLSAEFVGLAQLLVYVGAVAILVLMALLLTRNAGAETPPVFLGSWRWGAAVAVLVGLGLVTAIATTRALPTALTAAPSVSTREIGQQLMTRHVLPLEVLGLLFTAAMIGAIILALPGRREP